jgi:hypothetical protein
VFCPGSKEAVISAVELHCSLQHIDEYDNALQDPGSDKLDSVQSEHATASLGCTPESDAGTARGSTSLAALCIFLDKKQQFADEQKTIFFNSAWV